MWFVEKSGTKVQSVLKAWPKNTTKQDWSTVELEGVHIGTT